MQSSDDYLCLSREVSISSLLLLTFVSLEELVCYALSMAAPLQQRCMSIGGPQCQIPRARGPPLVQPARVRGMASSAHFPWPGSRILYNMAQAASLRRNEWHLNYRSERDGRSVWSDLWSILKGSENTCTWFSN